jgi:diketogulonate reductase-like aldo/keto reductase
MLNIESKIRLNNGVEIPRLGLGVFRAPEGGTTRDAVKAALKLGYRHIDTAKVYGNEHDVGRGIRESGIPRDQIWVTTKLWNSDQGYQSTLQACDESLQKLGLDYLDLYLVHWPVPGARLESWRAMETLLAQGKCRTIGVSNFMVRHIEELLKHCKVVPAINQIELTPYNYLFRKAVVDICQANQIQMEAYSPLTKGLRLGDPKLVKIAEKYGKSTAQILIRWVVQQNTIVIPKSIKADRIQANAEIFDFEISAADMALLETFNENLVTGWDPTNQI